ncbi:hypothetical protein AHAS_Ahas04G0181600 [Arachis hypogaea]
MVYEKDLLATQYPRSTQTSLNEVQERAEKYINMEENSRLGEISKTEHSYSSRDKDKESKKKEDQHREKPRKYHNYTPSGVSCGCLPRTMQY